MKIERLNSLPENVVSSLFDSPVGQLTLVASDQALHGLFFANAHGQNQCKKYFPTVKKSDQHALLLAAKQQLIDYFQDKKKLFSLPVALWGTEFQWSAWQQLANIPYGKTITYGEQAARLGDKNKARAVGMANGANPLAIIVPCHRVVGANGKLTGFGGGLDKKELLLLHESQS